MRGVMMVNKLTFNTNWCVLAVQLLKDRRFPVFAITQQAKI